MLLMALSGYVTYSGHRAMRPFKRENYKTKQNTTIVSKDVKKSDQHKSK